MLTPHPLLNDTALWGFTRAPRPHRAAEMPAPHPAPPSRMAHAPMWLRELLTSPRSERQAMRHLAHHIAALVEGQDWLTLNALLILPCVEDLSLPLQSGLLRYTYDARCHLPHWERALDHLRQRIEARGEAPSEHLYGLLTSPGQTR